MKLSILPPAERIRADSTRNDLRPAKWRKVRGEKIDGWMVPSQSVKTDYYHTSSLISSHLDQIFSSRWLGASVYFGASCFLAMK